MVEPVFRQAYVASMGLTHRHYLFSDDGALKRVPRRICDALPFGQDGIPEYAGTRQRVAQVLIENEDRRPVRILDATGHFWTFDAEGRIDAALREGMADWMDVAFAPERKREGRVVDLVPEIKKKQLHKRDRWDLTSEDLDRIAADIWPGINGPAPEVSSVTGKAAKKPPLPYDAKHAMQEIEGDVETIKFKMHRLSEHSLKGLEFEAERTASYDDPHFWQAVAAEAKLQRDILAAHRTGKGEWYAVIVATQVKDRIIAEEVATSHTKCATRKEAIEAGRQLMIDKASWLAADTTLEVAIYSALEWQPEAD